MQLEKIRQKKPLVSIAIQKIWQRDLQDPFVDMKKLEAAYRRIPFLESLKGEAFSTNFHDIMPGSKSKNEDLK